MHVKRYITKDGEVLYEERGYRTISFSGDICVGVEIESETIIDKDRIKELRLKGKANGTHYKPDKNRIDIVQFECLRCGHQWQSKIIGLQYTNPSECPECQSIAWDVPQDTLERYIANHESIGRMYGTVHLVGDGVTKGSFFIHGNRWYGAHWVGRKSGIVGITN